MNTWGWAFAAVAYLLLVGFFVIERWVRVRTTRDMSREDSDRGSTTWVSVAMGIAFVVVPATPLLNWWGPGAMHALAAAVVGALLGALGLAVRYRAFTTLGRFFTRTLRQTDEHHLVTDGVYRRIRHPGYLSDLLIFVGASLAMNNWITLVVVVVLFAPAYWYRIAVEEDMLTQAFGQQYRDYQATSKRLLPFVW
ncbi:MAG: isoprenylcysteine carboxylmethyltransferase family protein [Micrococcales bacterium]|nr:isoprenylcysteine carboxylmethyltransferase family protein [Micrococcales bacterium]